MAIQAKAKSLFENLNATEPDSKAQSLSAGAGWFEHFKGHHTFHNLRLTGQAAAAVIIPAKKFPVPLQVTSERHGYLSQQVFSLDETRLFWKQMPSRMFVSVPERI
jgi:hypothetical protein